MSSSAPCPGNNGKSSSGGGAFPMIIGAVLVLAGGFAGYNLGFYIGEIHTKAHLFIPLDEDLEDVDPEKRPWPFLPPLGESTPDDK